MFSKPVYTNINHPQPQYNTKSNFTRLPSFNELLTSIPLPNEFHMSRQSSPVYPVQYYYQPVGHQQLFESVSPKTLLPTPPPSANLQEKDIKRKHTCKVCSRSFTTSGHLARHNRIHTGERKHACPWPTCDARFARQDNCMQHYKTHTNGKKRSKLNFKNKSINPK